MQRFDELFEEVRAMRILMESSPSAESLSGRIESFKDFEYNTSLVSGELTHMSSLSSSNEELQLTATALQERLDAADSLAGHLQESLEVATSRVSHLQESLKMATSRAGYLQESLNAANSRANYLQLELQVVQDRCMTQVLEQQDAGRKRAGSPLPEQERKRHLSQREADLLVAQHILHDAQRQLEADREKLNAQELLLQEGLKSQRETLQAGQTLLETTQARITASDESLQAKEDSLRARESQQEASQKQLQLAQQLLCVDQANVHSEAEKLQNSWTRLEEVRARLQRKQGQLWVDQDQLRAETLDAIQKSQTSSHQELSTKTALESVMKHIMDETAQVAKRVQDATTAQLDTLTDPEKFWEKAAATLAERLYLVPVVRAGSVTWDSLCEVFIQLYTNMESRDRLTGFVETAPQEWYCLKLVLASGDWGDVVDDVCPKHTRKHDVCIAVTVEQFDTAVGVRHGLSLRRVEPKIVRTYYGQTPKPIRRF